MHDPTRTADSLLDVLEQVPDPRDARGRRYDLTSVLLLALAATVGGARSFTAIGEWAADASTTVLTRLGFTGRAPSESAIRRVLQRLDADRLDQLICAWMWLRVSMIGGAKVVSFDGKALRGARDAAGHLTYLLSGICQATGAVIAQVSVADKTSEVPMLRKLLSALNISGCVITADAAHTCRETAQSIVDAGAHYILCVKGNQPNLRKRLKQLPWDDVPVLDKTTGKPAHGRRETRTVKATGISSGIGFPGAAQVLRIHRTRTVVSKHRKSRKQTRETVFVVTSLNVGDAAHHVIADYLRQHWSIENKIHHVRDVVFDEDRHQARTGAAGHVMAILRNTTMSLLRLAGHRFIAPALRHHGRDCNRPLELLLAC
ncbi:ISAs1 family transposase [Nocardia asteroides]|uniref:ISAs1 family transposase n=1 Tax=Nocardia asteroides TaxID=1824 RepID=UPI00342107D0